MTAASCPADCNELDFIKKKKKKNQIKEFGLFTEK
jgi:hypothetical protein